MYVLLCRRGGNSFFFYLSRLSGWGCGNSTYIRQMNKRKSLSSCAAGTCTMKSVFCHLQTVNCCTHTVYGVHKARILKWFAFPFSSGPHFIRTLHRDPSILGGPAQHGSRTGKPGMLRSMMLQRVRQDLETEQQLVILGLPWWLGGKELTCQCRRQKFYLWVRKIPWRRKWKPSPVFLPGKPHGQKSLAGYCPWGHKESWLSD